MVMATVIPLVYVGERHLINFLVHRTPPSVRRLAYDASTIDHAVLQQKARLPGFPCTDSSRRNPECSAFMAILPFYAEHAPGLRLATLKFVKVMVDRDVRSRFGGPRAAYENYRLSVESLRSAYEEYQMSVAKIAALVGDMPRLQQQAWNRYVASLRGHGLVVGAIPTRYWPYIVRQVRNSGTPVGYSWNPNDRVAFDDAVSVEYSEKARADYSKAVSRILRPGKSLPPTLSSFDRFLKYPSIQRLWHERLGVPSGVILDPYLSFNEYSRDVYHQSLRNLVRREIRRRGYLAPISAFAKGGFMASEGRRATEAVLVPLIALGFSLAGAIVHALVKLTAYMLEMVTPLRALPRYAVGVLLCALVALVFWRSPTPVTNSMLYKALNRQIATQDGVAMARALTITVQGENYAYPVFRALRDRALRNYQFGALWRKK